MTSSNGEHVSIEALFESARMKVPLDALSISHLGGCAVCRGRLSWMQGTADLGVHEMNYEPPASALNQVLRLGRTPGYFKRFRNFVVASLTFDSFTAPATAGVRRTETSSREMTYAADDLEIAVSLRRGENESLTVMGQVLSKTASRSEQSMGYVDLVLDGDHIASSPVSEWGEFMFENLPRAQYNLQVYSEDRVIRIPELPGS
jgi:hypothetical protein